MKNFYTLSTVFALLFATRTHAQSCAPQGDQVTYGTNNVWIGYAYQGRTFTTYKGYVTEGVTASPNFDESFGGNQVNYATNGCSIYTDDFAMRYRLRKTFANANYAITVGGDDGYRLSIDGGATWIINNWADHGYATTTYNIGLNGTYDLVLEYYENGGANRVSFDLTQICTGAEDQSVYGTNNTWAGYIYQGMNFGMYKGLMYEGSAASPNFDENFGNTAGSNTYTFATSGCTATGYQFSARYRLTKSFPNMKYIFTVGGDDGFRLSLDGGNTWVINKWNDQSYTTSSYTVNLNGTYNMVLEYYQNGGYDRVSFSLASNTLPVTLVRWNVSAISTDENRLTWQATNAVNFDRYVIQRSTDGKTYTDVHTTPYSEGTGDLAKDYAYTDNFGYGGVVYYRLMMVDIDGSMQYSNVISIAQRNAPETKIYPTVVDNDLFVETASPVANARFELFDISGNRIRTRNLSAMQGRQQINIKENGNIPGGAYVARLTDGQNILAKQVIIVR